MELKIAFLQILPGNSTDENLVIGKNACIEAKEKGADIALFPEGAQGTVLCALRQPLTSLPAVYLLPAFSVLRL